MEKFDLTRYKYQVILILVLITFVLAICHAFTYLPVKTETKTIDQNNLEVTIDQNYEEQNNTEEQAEPEEDTEEAESEATLSIDQFSGSRTADSDEYIRSTKSRSVGDF